jgi:Tfp pilus assembly protein PilF
MRIHYHLFFHEDSPDLLPDMAAAHFGLADVYEKRGKLDLAIDEYKRASRRTTGR